VNVTETTAHDALPTVLVSLLKSVVYCEQSPLVWRDMLRLQGAVRDYLKLLSLEVIIDEIEGYAYVRQRMHDDTEAEPDTPKLIPKWPLSYPVSLLLVLLRKRLALHDAQGGATRLVLTGEQIVEMMRTFLPTAPNEAKHVDQIERHIARIEELGFLKRLKSDEAVYEVRRILRAFVNADRLAEFETLYREHADRLA
jgi:uncharacterized protein DUF4194